MNILTQALAILVLGVPIALHSTNVIADSKPASEPAAVPVKRTGTLSAWQILDDGTVLLRLRGKTERGPFDLWFATPANRTATTRLEALVLEAVLHAHREQTVITVTSETSNEVRGRTPSDAFPMKSIGAG